MSLCKVSIAAERSGEYSRKFIRKADAEIETPSEFGTVDFVRGCFLGLRDAELLDLLRLKDLHLHIEGQRYRLLSVEDNGAFIAVKEA